MSLHQEIVDHTRCLRKIRHETADSARKHADIFPGLVVYACERPGCGGYHVGHPKPMNMKPSTRKRWNERKHFAATYFRWEDDGGNNID